jgi:L-lysine exporter family protein LysE/ArgO
MDQNVGKPTGLPFKDSRNHVFTSAMLLQIGKGILVGLGAAVPIGPVNVEIARRTLRGGFAAGMALGLGAVSVDVTYAVLSCLSVGRFMDHHAVSVPLTIGGMVLLSYLGVQCLRAAWQSRPVFDAADPSLGSPASRIPLRNGYFVGLLMTFFNPMTIGFWFVALPATAGSLSGDAARRQLPLICAGVFLGTVGWVLTFTGTLSALGRFRRDIWLLVADTLGGATLLAFALALFLRSIRPLL